MVPCGNFPPKTPMTLFDILPAPSEGVLPFQSESPLLIPPPGGFQPTPAGLRAESSPWAPSGFSWTAQVFSVGVARPQSGGRGSSSRRPDRFLPAIGSGFGRKASRRQSAPGRSSPMSAQPVWPPPRPAGGPSWRYSPSPPARPSPSIRRTARAAGYPPPNPPRDPISRRRKPLGPGRGWRPEASRRRGRSRRQPERRILPPSPPRSPSPRGGGVAQLGQALKRGLAMKDGEFPIPGRFHRRLDLEVDPLDIGSASGPRWRLSLRKRPRSRNRGGRPGPSSSMAEASSLFRAAAAARSSNGASKSEDRPMPWGSPSRAQSQSSRILAAGGWKASSSAMFRSSRETPSGTIGAGQTSMASAPWPPRKASTMPIWRGARGADSPGVSWSLICGSRCAPRRRCIKCSEYGRSRSWEIASAKAEAISQRRLWTKSISALKPLARALKSLAGLAASMKPSSRRMAAARTPGRPNALACLKRALSTAIFETMASPSDPGLRRQRAIGAVSCDRLPRGNHEDGSIRFLVAGESPDAEWRIPADKNIVPLRPSTHRHFTETSSFGR